eukprot:1915170-Prymnesium_polylepis.1
MTHPEIPYSQLHPEYNHGFGRDREVPLGPIVGRRLRHGIFTGALVNAHFVQDGKPWQTQNLSAYPTWLALARVYYLVDWLQIAHHNIANGTASRMQSIVPLLPASNLRAANLVEATVNFSVRQDCVCFLRALRREGEASLTRVLETEVSEAHTARMGRGRPAHRAEGLERHESKGHVCDVPGGDGIRNEAGGEGWCSDCWRRTLRGTVQICDRALTQFSAVWRVRWVVAPPTPSGAHEAYLLRSQRRRARLRRPGGAGGCGVGCVYTTFWLHVQRPTGFVGCLRIANLVNVEDPSDSKRFDKRLVKQLAGFAPYIRQPNRLAPSTGNLPACFLRRACIL